MNRPWTKSYGPRVPLEIDADAHRSVVALFERDVVHFANQPAFECFGKVLTAEVSEPEILAHCCGQLATYKAPRQVDFVEELPKSNVGKILRRELRAAA